MNRTFSTIIFSAILSITLAGCVEDQNPGVQAKTSLQTTSAVVAAVNEPALVSLESFAQVDAAPDSDALASVSTELESSCCWSTNPS